MYIEAQAQQQPISLFEHEIQNIENIINIQSPREKMNHYLIFEHIEIHDIENIVKIINIEPPRKYMT
jgi:hypothetical protein